MEPKKERLYDAMGELIYALALADGEVSQPELDRLDNILRMHPWATSIQWSFNYENKRVSDLEDAYQRALETCKEYGPSEEYIFLMEVLRQVAEASEGIVTKEAALIHRFEIELTDYFKDHL